ncbi:caspase recruitment domain-containing protein 10 [Tachyglossus aculeatus]|uniref:caspase recruitment domain-containing protein 10 n=1 Tax=Tachyglossus aculeatus TaxID=9261 RepID=UPI0018F663AD|nr:caspase recruitment domain-containing protein 10 [Tachyglossus aculeatus]
MTDPEDWAERGKSQAEEVELETQEEAVAGEDEVLWEKIESVRHTLTRALNPAKLTPYLRQCRVIDEQDEEEVLCAYRFPCKINRTGRLMDILRGRGKRGCEAFLEALEFYYPEHFTLLTGREPSQRCSMILDEEGPEGLTQFLMTEVKRLRVQRKGQLQKEQQLQARSRALEEEVAHLERRLREQQQVQERCQRLREDWESGSLELLRLKDENYIIAMRLAQLSEEKNTAVLRSRDLQLAVDQLKCKVSRLEEECSLLRRHKGPPSPPTGAPGLEEQEQNGPDLVLELQAENQRLTASLQELQEGLQKETLGRSGGPGSERILLDILEHDWKEAQDNRQELCQKLHTVQGELQWAEELRDKYLQEMEDLQLKHRTLQKDCDLYKHRMNTILAQLEEIEKERDQAIQSRDRTQLQYSQSLVEKDQYRKQVRGLEAERDELLTSLTRVEGAKSLLEAQLQRAQGGLGMKACTSSHSLCSNVSSTWSLSECCPSLLGAPEGPGEATVPGGSEQQTLETTVSEKEINRLSILPFPPSAGSILRRQREEDPAPPKRSFSSMSDITGSVTLKPWSPGLSSSSSSDSVWPGGKPDPLLSHGSDLELLNRSLVRQASELNPPGGPEPPNRGPDGPASLPGGQCGAPRGQEPEGAQQLRGDPASQEDPSSQESFPLRLLHWNEPSALTLLLDSQACQSLRDDAEAGKKAPGGRSFYIRANHALPEQANPRALCVKGQEILRVVDTCYKGRREWYCSRVDPLTLRDLDRGTVPNYQRAQQLLDMQEKCLHSGRHRSHRSNLKKRALDQLRLVKPKHLGGLGESSEPLLSEPCPEPDRPLKPYSLVRPLVVPAPRPVVLSPECLAPRLIRNLLDLPTSRLDFHVCPAESLFGEEPPASSAPGAPKARPAPQGPGGRIRAIQESIGKNKHCLLELGTQGVRELVRNEIYPIVIHVEVTEKNIRGVRSLLGRPGWRDSELLKQCRSTEHSLWGLPCSWARVDAHSWSHAEELAKVVRGRILQEQARVVWVESGEI